MPAMWCGQASGVDERHIVFVLVVREGETSMREEVTSKLQSVFEKVLEANDITITREMTAQDIEAWDSLRHIQLLNEVERAFGIKFKLREVLKMKNVGDLIDLIHAKQGVPA
jgi:acyl carrier protein